MYSSLVSQLSAAMAPAASISATITSSSRCVVRSAAASSKVAMRSGPLWANS